MFIAGGNAKFPLEGSEDEIDYYFPPMQVCESHAHCPQTPHWGELWTPREVPLA